MVVLPPHEMSFIVMHVEVEVGKKMELPLTVFAFVDQGMLLLIVQTIANWLFQKEAHRMCSRIATLVNFL